MPMAWTDRFIVLCLSILWGLSGLSGTVKGGTNHLTINNLGRNYTKNQDKNEEKVEVKMEKYESIRFKCVTEHVFLYFSKSYGGKHPSKQVPFTR